MVEQLTSYIVPESKQAVIIGASGDIGNNICKDLLQQGFNVKAIDKVKGKIIHDKLEYFVIDLSKADAINSLEEISNLIDKVDLLVNAQGVIFRKSIENMTLEAWNETINVNLTSVFISIKAFLKNMKESSSIINISSGWGINGGDLATAYCASKGGVNLLTKALCIELSRRNIRVNAICPGDIDTKMLTNEESQLNLKPGTLKKEGINRPSKRIGTTEDISKAVLFLASESSSYINGSILVIDGGSLAGTP